jgi:cationic peptide transport system substrate-binding protein
MRLVLSSFLHSVCSAAWPLPRPSGLRSLTFVTAVVIASAARWIPSTAKAGSGLIVDTLAAQLYDRLLDVDPYTYRLVPELAESWEVLDNGDLPFPPAR